jgi:hypothetical protein
MAEAANLPLRVEVNHYRVRHEGLGRADLAGVLFSLEARAPWEPEPGESATVLQILGLYLVSHLVEEGRVGEGEAHRLELAFNNHDPLDNNTEA